jgi:hypothetical protein
MEALTEHHRTTHISKAGRRSKPKISHPVVRAGLAGGFKERIYDRAPKAPGARLLSLNLMANCGW